MRPEPVPARSPLRSENESPPQRWASTARPGPQRPACPAQAQNGHRTFEREPQVGGEEEPPTEEMHTWQMHGDHRVKSRRGATTENYTKATHEMQVT